MQIHAINHGQCIDDMKLVRVHTHTASWLSDGSMLFTDCFWPDVLEVPPVISQLRYCKEMQS